MAGIKKRLGSLLGPQGRTPQFDPPTTTQVAAGEPAGVTRTQTGPISYRDDFTIPKGIDGDPNAVADFSQAFAAEVNTEGTPGQTALNAQFVPFGNGQGLNIWDAHTLRTNYSDVIGDADTALLPHATKTQIGTASDGATPIWAYTTGAVDAPHAALVSGSHGHEVMPVGACHEWMEAFVGGHPAMRELRSRLRVTWIPALNASQYRGTRENSNGVDLNRNYDLSWGLSASAKKGTAPLSEPESSTLATYLQTSGAAFLLDTHHHGNEPGLGEVAIAGPAVWSGGDRSVTAHARKRVQDEYAGSAYTVTDYALTNPYPMSHFWAAKYLRWDLGRVNGGSCLIECSHDLAGSTPWLLTAEAARLYCGSITSVFTEWLDRGQYVPHAPWSDIHKQLARLEGFSTPVQSGGLLINSEVATPVTWDDGTNHFVIPIVGPGVYRLTYTAHLYSNAAPQATILGVKMGPMPASGDLTSASLVGSGGRHTHTVNGDVTLVSRYGEYEVTEMPDEGLLMGQVTAALIGAGEASVRTHDGMTAFVTYQPKDGHEYPANDIPRSSP